MSDRYEIGGLDAMAWRAWRDQVQNVEDGDILTLVSRNQRLRNLRECNAPHILISREVELVQAAVDLITDRFQHPARWSNFTEVPPSSDGPI